MNSSFLPFVWVLIGSLKFPPFVRSFRLFFSKFLAVRAVFKRLIRSLTVRLQVLEVNRGVKDGR